MLNGTPRNEPAGDAILIFSGAGDGIRTRDIQLGRLALYHLSYPRRQDRRRPAALQPTVDANLTTLIVPNQSPEGFSPTHGRHFRYHAGRQTGVRLSVERETPRSGEWAMPLDLQIQQTTEAPRA